MLLERGIRAVVVACAVTTCATTGCRRDAAETAPPAARALPETIVLEARSVPKTLSYVGTIIAPRDAIIASTRGGRVDAYAYEVGQSVESGALLVKLGAAELAFASQAAAASATQAAARIGGAKDPANLPGAQAAKSSYEIAVDAARRAEKLHAQGSLSEQELTRARANEASAKAQYDGALAEAQAEFGRLKELMATAGQAQAALGDKAIRAPFAGVVLERFVEVGQIAAPNAPLVRVIDPTELRIRFDVPQFDADKVALGRKVTILVDGAMRSANVVRSTPGLVGESNARLVEASIDAAAEAGDAGAPSLLPGARYTAWLEIGGSEELVDVPLSSTTSTAGLLRAWVVDEGRLSERLLSVARFEGDRVLVRGGLKGGERLVKTPQPDFRLGEAVAAKTGEAK
ncbi:MAG: efflux RND transporter periplasmic adaptor subunit [Labilithrix sp.]|nr:efflux RND transporter periplasmic adaptor subunit [Labilithrix sp.]